MANTDYIQATIELFGFFITIIIALIFKIITANERKSEKNLFMLMLSTGFSLLTDGCWYICDGNTSSITMILNRITNLAGFICNPIMIYFLSRYIISLVEEKGKKPGRIIVFITYFFILLSLLIPVSNLFYTWMYTFGTQNIYRRLAGWTIYTACNSLGLILCAVFLFIYRNYVSKKRRTAVLFFILAPFIGIGIQSAKLGFSFIQLGTSIGTIGVLVTYLIEWIQKEKDGSDTSEDKKRLWLIECVFGIMILFVSAAIISCVVSVYKVSNKTSEQSSMALSYMVSETIDGALSEPINVSRTMAQSNEVIAALSADKLEGTEAEKIMLSFMKRIKNEYGYQMIFAASAKTKAYYTYDGISRYMQVDTDPKDAWYNEFTARNVKYELNIDEDKDNEMTLAVFVNMEVRDADNNFIGVCGVGTSVESLLDLLLFYENTYSLDISLTDMDGIVQIDTIRERVGKPISDDITPDGNSDKVTYIKYRSKARLSKYMNGLGWYLVIDDNKPNKLNAFETVLPSVVIYIIGILIMVFFSLGFGISENRRNRQLMASKLLSEVDRLSGVKNRNAFESFKKQLKEDDSNNPSMQIVMMDINGLKTVNDKLGHIAGDELIIGATKCIKETLGKTGEIYRVGGDEFVVICNSNQDSVKEAINQLNQTTSGWSGDLVKELAISIGFASSEENPDYKFDDLMKLADERMYADKNAYYRRTGKDRRMSW